MTGMVYNQWLELSQIDFHTKQLIQHHGSL
jgi:hypothetical protein